MLVSRIEGHYQLDSLIEKTLQPELLQGILCLLWPQDMTRACLVSRYWRDLTIETAKLRETRVVQTFGKFLGCVITEWMNFQLAENLVDIRNLQAKYRLELVKELARMEKDYLSELERSSAKIRKPLFFDNLFDLAKLQGMIDRESDNFSSDDFAEYSLQLCDLASFENSIALGPKAAENDCEDLFKDIALKLCNVGKTNRALEIADWIENIDLRHKILIELFACGAFAEARVLAQSLQMCDEWIEVLELIFTGPFNEQRISALQDMDLIQKALDRSCKQLIEEERFDEFRLLLSLSNVRDYLNRLFAEKLIQMDRFNEAEEIYSPILTTHFNRYAICSALNSKRKFEKSREIAEKITKETTKKFAEQDIQFYEYLFAKKYEEAMANYTDDFVMTKALADSGQLDKAVEFALTIFDYAIKAKCWRYLNNFFDI